MVRYLVQGIILNVHIHDYTMQKRRPWWLWFLPPYKGKAIPLQAWADLEGFRRLRHPDF
jgi:hypothetical protein